MEQDPVREQKIIGIIKQEIDDGQSLADEARKMVEYLLLEKKGYARDEVKKNVVFEIDLAGEKVNSCVDFQVTVEGRKAMIVKCVAGSLDSRERQVVAAARLLDAAFAVVADPHSAEVLDAMTGKVEGEGFGAIPVREQIIELLNKKEPNAFSPERMEKEKRILLAFDAIRCTVPQGGDGAGVQIGPEPGTEDNCKC